MQKRQAWALLALLAVLAVLVIGQFAVLDPEPTARAIETAGGSPASRSAEAPADPAPEPRAVTPLGPGAAIRVPLPDGRILDVRLWLAAQPGSPLVVATTGNNVSAPEWLPVLETLRAHRDASVAVILGVAGAPPAADPTARVREQELLLAAAVAALRAKPGVEAVPVAVLASGDAATAALLYMAATQEISALAVLSAAIDVPDLDVRDAMASIARRQVFVGFADKGENADAGRELLARLLNRRAVVVPGMSGGVELLALPALHGDLVGWLYAALGPVTRPAPAAAPPLDPTQPAG